MQLSSKWELHSDGSLYRNTVAIFSREILWCMYYKSVLQGWLCMANFCSIKFKISTNGLWYLLWTVQIFIGFTHSYCTLCFFKRSRPGCWEEGWGVILFCLLHTGLLCCALDCTGSCLQEGRCSFQIVTRLLCGRVPSDGEVGRAEWKGRSIHHLSRLNARKDRSHLSKGDCRGQQKAEGWMAALGLAQPMGHCRTWRLRRVELLFFTDYQKYSSRRKI